MITTYKIRSKPPFTEGGQPRPREGTQPGERANAQLGTWRILRKLRCCPGIRQLAKAIHIIQTRQTGA